MERNEKVAEMMKALFARLEERELEFAEFGAQPGVLRYDPFRSEHIETN